MRVALALRDEDATERIAHTLKGELGYLGLSEAAHNASQLEEASRLRVADHQFARLSERRIVTKKAAAEARGRATAAEEQIVPALFQEPGDRDHNRGPKTERKQTCESPRHKKLHLRESSIQTMSIKLVDYMQAKFSASTRSHRISAAHFDSHAVDTISKRYRERMKEIT
jgi:HPt (histidine-containing phosphotransfer) domain-containing protein